MTDRPAQDLLKMVVDLTAQLQKADIAALAMPFPDEIQIGVGDNGRLDSATDSVYALIGTAAMINGLIQTDIGRHVDLKEWMRLQMAVLQRAAKNNTAERVERNVQQVKEQLEARQGADIGAAFTMAIKEADDTTKLIIERGKEWAAVAASFDGHTAEQMADTVRNLLGVVIKLALQDDLSRGRGGLNILFALLALTSRIADRAPMTPASPAAVTVSGATSTRKH